MTGVVAKAARFYCKVRETMNPDQRATGETEEDAAPTTLEPGGPNAIAIMLGLLGDEWNLRILRHAFAGARRYGDYQKRLPISNAVLSGRLQWLTEVELLRHARYQVHPPRFEYRLAKRGRELWATLSAILMWESRWGQDESSHLTTIDHIGCSDHVELILGCKACGRPTGPRDVRGHFGPSGGWLRSVPASSTRRRSNNRQTSEFDETMAIMGNRWSAAIHGAMLQGVTRFGDFESVLAIPPTVLSNRLTKFQERGIVRANPSAQRADWNEYHLAEKGLDFYTVDAFAFDWAQRWFIAPEGPALITMHLECGEEFHPIYTCASCAQRVRARDLRLNSPDGGVE